jgi:hypothetical protein
MPTTTEFILNYASSNNGFLIRKELFEFLKNGYTDKNVRTIDLQLNRLVKSGNLIRLGYGKYRLNNNSPEFIYKPSNEEKLIFAKLKSRFPLLNFCIWSPKVLSAFMLHIPNIGYTLIDVEKEGMESVFNALQEIFHERKILFNPSKKECDLYLTGSNAIVVRQLISQSPLTTIDGCTVPRLEKILVDSIEDNELKFTQGTEIYNIYDYALERNNINIKKLLRYASRRNRKEKAQQIINTINYDKQEK